MYLNLLTGRIHVTGDRLREQQISHCGLVESTGDISHGLYHICTIHITQITRSHASQITQIIQITQTRLVMLHWTGGYLGPGGVREILPDPSTLVGRPSPLLSPIPGLFRHIQA